MSGGPDCPPEISSRFPVAGAGELCVGPDSRTGGAVGLSISVSWGRYKYAGGVVDRKDVQELHDLLGKWLAGENPFGVGEVRPTAVVGPS